MTFRLNRCDWPLINQDVLISTKWAVSERRTGWKCGRMLERLGLGVIPGRALLRFPRWSPRRQLGKEFPRCFHSVPTLSKPDCGPIEVLLLTQTFSFNAAGKVRQQYTLLSSVSFRGVRHDKPVIEDCTILFSHQMISFWKQKSVFGRAEDGVNKAALVAAAP